MSLATPRVLPSHLHAFAPESRPTISTVRILGTISSISGDQATLTSCNHEAVTLILNRDSHVSLNSLYEVVGKVINLEGGMGFGIRVLSVTEWPRLPDGCLPDLSLFEAVVDATHRHKGIFYEGEGEAGQENGAY